MNTIYVIIWFVMIYTWIHTVVLIYKNFKIFSLYQKIVLNTAIITLILFIIWSLS